jgi:hypothetical protein
LRLCAKLDEHILHGYSTVLRKPRLSFVKAAAVLPRHRFIVERSRGQGAGNGIDHHFEQVAHGGELAGIKLVE